MKNEHPERSRKAVQPKDAYVYDRSTQRPERNAVKSKDAVIRIRPLNSSVPPSTAARRGDGSVNHCVSRAGPPLRRLVFTAEAHSILSGTERSGVKSKDAATFPNFYVSLLLAFSVLASQFHAIHPNPLE